MNNYITVVDCSPLFADIMTGKFKLLFEQGFMFRGIEGVLF